MNLSKWSLGLVFCVGLVAFGAETPSGSTTAAAPSLTDSLVGRVQIAPSYRSKQGTWRSENSYRLGYRFNRDTRAFFEHRFNNNLYNASGSDSSFDYQHYQAFVRADFRNLWVNNNWSFNVTPRIYFPFDGQDRADGYYGSGRVYLSLRNQVSDTFSMHGDIIPVIHGYSQAANESGSSANKSWEFRTYVGGDYRFAQNWGLYVPLQYKQKHYRTASGASRSGATVHQLVLYPEVSHRFDRNFSLGVALETGSLVESDFGAFQIGDAFETAKYQMIFRASL